MKRTVLGALVLLGILLISIASASAELPKEAKEHNTQIVASQSVVASTQTDQVAANTKSKAMFTQTEANSLRIQGDDLLNETDAGEIKVGSIDGNDLVYILVVVLLVVVILAVVH